MAETAPEESTSQEAASDQELLLKLLANPEMAVLLKSLARSLQGKAEIESKAVK